MKMRFVLPLLIILISVQILGTYLALPLNQNNITVFGNPQDLRNPVEYLVAVIIMTAIILILYKAGWGKMVSVVIMMSVWATLWTVINALAIGIFGPPTPFLMDVAAVVIPAICVLLLWAYPEWYVIDIIGFFMCAGVAAVLGTSFGLVPIIVLLAIFAAYDAISVYKTKHMQKLAESVLTNKLPVIFIIPSTTDFSFREDRVWENLDAREERPAHILGMGDIIIPSALVVSANLFVGGGFTLGFFTIPAVGAMIGSVLGMLALQAVSERYPTSHAGLPLLNFFTILGFTIFWFV